MDLFIIKSTNHSVGAFKRKDYIVLIYLIPSNPDEPGYLKRITEDLQVRVSLNSMLGQRSLSNR